MKTGIFFTDARAEALAAAGAYIKSGGFAAYPETWNAGYRVVVFATREANRAWLSADRARQLLQGTSWQ